MGTFNNSRKIEELQKFFSDNKAIFEKLLGWQQTKKVESALWIVSTAIEIYELADYRGEI
jgi:hypothetical protein